jgi:double-strand break repair protein MRE11
MSAAEEEGFDISDNIEIAKFLKSRVNALIEKAQEQQEERNVQAQTADEQELETMLPLVRLKVIPFSSLYILNLLF